MRRSRRLATSDTRGIRVLRHVRGGDRRLGPRGRRRDRLPDTGTRIRRGLRAGLRRSEPGRPVTNAPLHGDTMRSAEATKTEQRALRDQAPIKVAVVGGGCASMTAAFELTRPEHAGRYQVTVYQVGWRLGGKGASGRGPADRIEEHGIHLWMGFYENAFRLMRECYSELNRTPGSCPIADWRDAFVPAPLIGLAEPAQQGHWSIWSGVLPPTEGLPGDPLPNGRAW